MVYVFEVGVVITIGIIIAWNINNLNEIRKSRAIELKINTTLNKELDTNLKVIDILLVPNPKYDKIKTFAEKSNYTPLLKSREYQNSIIDRLIQSKNQLVIAKNLRKKTMIISVNLSQELS